MKRRQTPKHPKVEAWVQPGSGKQPTDDPLTALREENQRLRIERTGFISEIEELKDEIARLRPTSGQRLQRSRSLTPILAGLASPPTKNKRTKKVQETAPHEGAEAMKDQTSEGTIFFDEPHFKASLLPLVVIPAMPRLGL